jgi:hypothetical protein
MSEIQRYDALDEHGIIGPESYMETLTGFMVRHTDHLDRVKHLEFQLRAADADYQERIRELEARLSAADELADAVDPIRHGEVPSDSEWSRLATALTAYLEASDNRASDACADCGATGVNLMTVTSGQSNKPETTTRLVCERCWGPSGFASDVGEASPAYRPDDPEWPSRDMSPVVEDGATAPDAGGLEALSDYVRKIDLHNETLEANGREYHQRLKALEGHARENWSDYEVPTGEPPTSTATSPTTERSGVLKQEVFRAGSVNQTTPWSAPIREKEEGCPDCENGRIWHQDDNRWYTCPTCDGSGKRKGER